jgi:hypothetical protein
VTEIEVVKRKIKLTRQGVKLSMYELDELEFKYTLLKAKSRLERRVKGKFDPVLSKRLDAVIYLLEERNGDD